MSDVVALAWAEEIRAYLLGRVQRDRATDALPRTVRSSMAPPPIRSWWLFEGKRYALFRGPLRANWGEVCRRALALLRNFNPAWRVADRPEGHVDWARTLARGGDLTTSEFVVQSSRVGINDDERAAIVGWAQWISSEWRRYCIRFGLYDVLEPVRGFSLRISDSVATDAQLRRWAHTTRRSRWPLMRDVIAETIRVVLEHQDVERVPLPTVRSTLFELLCFVRALKALVPEPTELRWIDPDLGDNRIDVGGVCGSYQWSLGRGNVLASSEFAGHLADALRVFRVGVPDRIDVSFRFSTPRRGIHGIVMEAKSGKQETAATVHQLKAYRSSIPRADHERWLVWGIAEEAGPITDQQRGWLAEKLEHELGDVWVFTNADDIPSVVSLLLGVQAPRVRMPELSTVGLATKFQI